MPKRYKSQQLYQTDRPRACWDSIETCYSLDSKQGQIAKGWRQLGDGLLAKQAQAKALQSEIDYLKAVLSSLTHQV